MRHPHLEDLSEKRITVFGANRSGIAIARLLYNHGAKISLTDSRNEDMLSSGIQQLDGMSIEFHLGGHSESCITNTELIVVSPGVPLDIPILIEAQNRRIPIIGELEVSSSLCPAQIVAITGTKGKSTTTLITAAILNTSRIFSKVVVAGNIGVPLASEVGTLTSKDIVILEASSFQLETTITFRPTVSVMLNFSRDHLDRHRTMEEYFKAKQKIYANQTSSDWLVLNAADTNLINLADATDARKAYFTDTYTNTDIEQKKHIYQQLDNCIKTILRSNGNSNSIYTFNGRQDHRICDVTEIPLAGSHNVRNVLAAVTIGTIFGVTPIQIRNAILNFNCIHPALKHAFEKVAIINGVEYINDSKATNVIATYAALESISNANKSGKNTKRVYLIIGGYDKGNNYEPLVGLVRKTVKCLILLGAHTQNIQNTFAGCCDMYHSETMQEAVKYTYSKAKPTDIVLLSPANASFDMYTDYKARGEEFNKAVHSLQQTSK